MSRPWVLYVEDSDHDREAFARAVAGSDACAADVVIAATAAEAKAAMSRHPRPPALALIDMRLPDANGLEVLRAVQVAWPGRLAPAVILSAYLTNELVEACSLAGAHSVLAKPASVAEARRQLSEVVQFWLGRNISTD